MKNPVVFMFSGQGSQYFNMGRKLFMENSTFRKWMLEFNEIYKNMTGESLIKVLYGIDKLKYEMFDRLAYSHPAIFMLEYSMAMTLMESGIQPRYLLGASLGEFVSAAVSGIMSFEDAFKCVIKQAEIVEKCCPAGGMTAVMDDPKMFEKIPELYKNTELALINYYSHFVISGSPDGLKKAERYLKAKDCIFMRLPIPFAFHSSLIEPAEPGFKQLFDSVVLKKPGIDMISCSSGFKKKAYDFEHFWNVVRRPVDFESIIKETDSTGEYIYIDLGPSGTLANFAKYNLDIRRRPYIFSIITPFNNGIDMGRLLDGVV